MVHISFKIQVKVNNMSSEEKISVYISTYNRQKKLERAVNSILNQDYKNIEIIVSDDNSKDTTNEYMNDLILKYKDIIYLRNEINCGACITRNNAIYAATGKYITGLDDDDEFTPNRLSTFITKWDPKFSFIASNFKERYSSGKMKPYYNRIRDKKYPSTHLLYDNNASNQIFTLRERLLGIGGFDKRVKRLQDWDTWLRLAEKYGTYYCIKDATYIMNHDHDINEKRVSKSYPSYLALEELVERNINFYHEPFLGIIKNTIDYERKSSKLSSSIKASFFAKDPRYIVKHIYQKLGFEPKG